MVIIVKNFIKFRQNWPNGSGEDEFIWIKLNLFIKRCFVPSSVKIGPVGLGKNFLISSMYFSLFHNNLPLEKGRPFILTNLNPLHPRMLCAKFGWNWPSGSGEDDEMWKVYRQTDVRRTTGNQKSLPELKELSAQVS